MMVNRNVGWWLGTTELLCCRDSEIWWCTICGGGSSVNILLVVDFK